MIENIGTIRLFYPMLFLTIGIILVVLICSAKSVMINFKGQDAESLRLTDTTTKMKDMHTDVIKTDFTVAHEKEIHHLEKMVQEINKNVDLLLERVTKLEQNQIKE